MDLTWPDTSEIEEGFIIERGLDGSSYTAITTNAPNTSSYTDTGLANETLYYYRLTAFNIIGNSTGNPVDSATTLTPAAVTAFSDDFTGADGTTVTNANWGYEEHGVNVPD